MMLYIREKQNPFRRRYSLNLNRTKNEITFLRLQSISAHKTDEFQTNDMLNNQAIENLP